MASQELCETTLERDSPALLQVTPDDAPAPPLWVLVALVPATAVAIALLTSIPARLAARQPIAEALDAEPA